MLKNFLIIISILLISCGAAAIAKFLADVMPDLYAKMAIDLYNSGVSTNNGYTISVTEEMKAGTTEQLGKIGMSSVDAIVQGALINTQNKALSFNPFNGESGVSSFMYPTFIKSFVESYVGKSVISIPYFPTLSYMKQINFRENFVIGLVHHTAKGSIGNGIPNHYVQITGMDLSNNIHFWTWGESKTRSSHIFGNIHGIYNIFIIPR